MRNLERFRQSSILSKNPTALFPPKPSIIVMCVHKHMLHVTARYMYSSATTVMKYSAFKSFAGDIRNDLYVTLEKGEFEKGNDILAFDFLSRYAL